MIQVIAYKAENLTSVIKALRYLGAETHVTQSPNVRGRQDYAALHATLTA